MPQMALLTPDSPKGQIELEATFNLWECPPEAVDAEVTLLVTLGGALLERGNPI